MNWLRSLTIAKRLYLNLLLLSAGILGVTLLMLWFFYQGLIEEKRTQTMYQVQQASSLVSHYYAQQQNGQLSELEARQQAITAIAGLRYGNDDYFWINDHHPRMILHPMKPELNGDDLSGFEDPDGKRLFVEMVRQVELAGRGFVHYLWPKPGLKEPVPKISYVQLFEPWGWIIGTGIYIDDVENQLTALAGKVMLMMLGLGALAVLVAIVLIRSILNPVGQTVNALRDISHGEADLRRRLDESGRDEITQLSQSFNQFCIRLGETIRRLSPISHEVAEASGRLSDIVRHNRRVSEQQSAETEQVATAMQEMLATSSEVASSAGQAASASRESSLAAEQGSQQVSHTCEHSSSLVDELSQAQHRLGALTERTKEIGTVLEVIRTIAEQTNLLALNAAIEAARAGEQGRGFAVVADEVRELATRTQSSTNEIEQIIHGLQQESDDTVTRMQTLMQRAEQTRGSAVQAGEALATITGHMQLINDMNNQIATAAEQQRQTTEEMSRNLCRLSELAEEVRHKTHETDSAGEALLNLGRRLSAEVDGFKA
ncbi:methyl-accepting chemotaxis protein [Oceanimonas baumannii]|uniref:Chemotaxis protein n=1 Tax=Oceanimonas baumannii TaxID=129578 RepID=A0A235CPP0_9GAMM|nr:methyl-accepting chemotaxis protein [Oceanimonas baumannii]OYD26344.1 chemotaxis protein [Oceanimonas baumannii]TDW61997.1 methyl-accepting chemotaxis sensory transducer with Cache sensor [Oceanimonas baumannii]